MFFVAENRCSFAMHPTTKPPQNHHKFTTICTTFSLHPPAKHPFNKGVSPACGQNKKTAQTDKN